jgi:outer membrane protein assembly factor BamE
MVRWLQSLHHIKTPLMRCYFSIFSALPALALLVGCATEINQAAYPASSKSPTSTAVKAAPTAPPVLSIYRALVVQGNVVTQEQKELLKPGLSKTQIRDFLGTPLVNSLFHTERWDYVFIYKRFGQVSQPKRLSLFFKDDLIERIESDALGSEEDFVAQFGSDRKFSAPPSLEASQKQLQSFAAERPLRKPGHDTPLAPGLPAVKLPLTGYLPIEN